MRPLAKRITGASGVMRGARFQAPPNASPRIAPPPHNGAGSGLGDPGVMRRCVPQGVHHRITDALPSSPERITPHHPGPGQVPDALDLAVRLLARQATTIVTARGEPENTIVNAPPVVCYVCRGTDFWAGTGKVTCRRCHPPAPGAERGAAA